MHFRIPVEPAIFTALNLFAMIKTAIAIACSLSLYCGALQAQGLKVPSPSPAQTIKQDFGLGNIERLTYSRPSTKGRKIFGDLVPFDKVWRTGANSATYPQLQR